MKNYFFIILLLGLTYNMQAQKSDVKSYEKHIKKHRKATYKYHKKNKNSPLSKKQAKKLTYFPPNIKYKVIADFKRTKDAKPFDIITSNGKTRKYVKYGLISFNLLGDTLQLAVYKNLRSMPQYKDHLFLPFNDATNGTSTYGGGRYIDLTLSDIKSSEVEIDFNKSYNPYCAYKDGYSCPIPPIENNLKVTIEAGEKVYEYH